MYLFTEKTTADKQRILTQVFDESCLSEQEKEQGYQINELPAYSPPAGKTGILYRNKPTGQFFYEYEDVVVPPDSIEQQIKDIQLALAAILGGAV